MAKQVNVRTDKDHRTALEAMVENDEADSPSEAMRQTSQAELARRGYLNGYSSGTVSWAMRKFGQLSAVVGGAWIAFFFFFPVEYRAGAVFWFIVALLSFGVANLMERDRVAQYFSQSEVEKA